ncbi:MAG: hypothetical protein Q4D61_02755 [Cardiobacteriaceae bacterium]|nr:hypothetical protein [Cardiobacteriaceae bacterium]
MPKRLPLVALLLAACNSSHRPAPEFARDGMTETLTYRCQQGRIDIEYARMGGTESATLPLENGRKVLVRTEKNRYTLDDWQWTAQTDGHTYTLLHHGETILSQCRSSTASSGKADDDGAGTVQLQLNKAFQ